MKWGTEGSSMQGPGFNVHRHWKLSVTLNEMASVIVSMLPFSDGFDPIGLVRILLFSRRNTRKQSLQIKPSS